MSRSFMFSTSMALAIASTTAMADVTPQQAADGLISYLENSGMTVAIGKEVRSGNDLTLENLRMTMEEDGATVTMHSERVEFFDQGDGTVRTTMADMPLVVEAEGVDGETVSVLGTIKYFGAETIISGTPDNMSFASNAPEFSFTLDRFELDGEDLGLELTGSALSTVGGFTLGIDPETGKQTLEQDFTIASVRGEFAGTIPSEDEFGTTMTDARVVFSVEDLSIKQNGTVFSMSSTDLSEEDYTEAVYSSGPSEMTFSIEDEDGTFDILFSSASSNSNLDLRDALATYGGRADGLAISAMGTMFPFPPVDLTIASVESSITMPVTTSTEVQDFALETRISGLQPSEMIWSMFDPFGSLSHDPIDLGVSVSGRGRMLVDVFDPNLDPEDIEGSPVELENIVVNEIALRALGAELSITGEFENMETNPLAAPMLEGGADIRLVGFQGLMQQLGQMGLLPAPQAGMANMFLGMFAVPGNAPDTFVSRIDMLKDGSILANGQRVR